MGEEGGGESHGCRKSGADGWGGGGGEGLINES